MKLTFNSCVLSSHVIKIRLLGQMKNLPTKYQLSVREIEGYYKKSFKCESYGFEMHEKM